MPSPKKLYKDAKKQQKMQYNTGMLLAQGVDAGFIAEQMGPSSLDTPEEYAQVQNAWKAAQAAGTAPKGVSKLRDAEYQWNPDEFLPGIQEQSGAIYDPRMAQIQALRKLQASQANEARMRTKEDFEARMKAEEQAINRRGAWFSGGAIRNEQDIRNEQMRTLERQDLQAMAGQQELLAQEGALGYEQSQFEKQALFNEEAGAYGRWRDERDYNYMFETNERNYAVGALMGANDSFTLRNNFGLSAGQFKLQQDRFKEDTRRYDQDFAWNKFMYNQMQK